MAFTLWLLRCFCRTDRKHCFHNIPARKINVNSHLWNHGQESQALGLQSQPTRSQFSLGFCLERKIKILIRILVWHWCIFTLDMKYINHDHALPYSCCVILFVCSQFSHSVMSDSLRPHGLQHVRPPCPSPTPGAYSNSCPLSPWCHPAISSMCSNRMEMWGLVNCFFRIPSVQSFGLSCRWWFFIL